VSEVSPLRRKSVLNPTQATAAFKSLFAQSDIPGILRLYEEQVDSRVKRQVVDWLVKHVEMLGVTPLLSVGSIETDEEMFRYMMRELLKLDRSAVCKQIEVETCPRPLLQVAVVLLSELGLRSALPKLQKCVEVGDAVVRSVALHGIGRSGEAAEPLVPLLLRTVELDSDKNVRLAAAKALQAMNTRKVYEAFEQKAHEVSLDPAVAHVLEELRAKFDPTGENRTRLRGGQGASKTDAKGTAKSAEKGSAHQGKAATLAIAVAVILAAAYFLFKRLTGQG
jgi:HEAT repeat protein